MKGNEGKEEGKAYKFKLSREQAESLLKEWAEYLELDPDRDLYADLVEELRMPVRTQRLTFDSETQVFKYQLFSPVNDKGIVELKDCDFEAKEVIEDYKDKETVKSSSALLSQYTNLTIEETKKIKTRDSNIMTAVTLGFLAQVAPGRKR